MIRFRWYRSGDLFGVRYEMERGDALPEHLHDRASEHNVIVLAGSVALEQPGARDVGFTGDVLDFDGSKLHTIRCLSQSATILNVFLHGMPQGYAELPASEHQGTLPCR